MEVRDRAAEDARQEELRNLGMDDVTLTVIFLERALIGILNAYERENPARLADFHLPDCDCLRCAVDNAAELFT